jgi:hypothetical protein
MKNYAALSVETRLLVKYLSIYSLFETCTFLYQKLLLETRFSMLFVITLILVQNTGKYIVKESTKLGYLRL